MIEVKPGNEFETSVDWGTTGLAGTLRVRLLDGDGGTTIAATTTGVEEFPASSGRYEVTLTAPDTAGQYQVFWDDGSVTVGHTAAGDDVLVTYSAIDPVTAGPAYATTDELARILKIRTPTAEQTTAMERVLIAATGEINSEIDLADGVDLEDWQLKLAEQVCLDRAADLWRHTESIPGVTGLLGDDGVVQPGRYSWERYAQRLAPLKGQWGLA